MKYNIKAISNIDGFRAELVGKDSLTIHDFTIDCISKQKACMIMTGIALGIIEDSIPHKWREIYDCFFYFNSFEYEDLNFTIREVC